MERERPKTTFIQDFRIAEVFGKDAINDTYNRCQEWREDVQMYTELVIALNTLCWYHHGQKDEDLAQLYADLYYEANAWAYDNYTGEDIKYYFDVTD